MKKDSMHQMHIPTVFARELVGIDMSQGKPAVVAIYRSSYTHLPRQELSLKDRRMLSELGP